MHYLVWLARKLKAEGETEFLIERMQPTWLTKKQKAVYVIVLVLIFGVIGVLIGGLIKVIYTQLIENFSTELIDEFIEQVGFYYGRFVEAFLIWVLNFVLILLLIEGVIFGLNFGVISGLVFGLNFGVISGLIVGLIAGLIVGLISGLNSVIQHFALRLILYRNGNIPWNYSRFLDYAVKHKFIQRVGGRYRFMHDLLREHFAQMPLN